MDDKCTDCVYEKSGEEDCEGCLRLKDNFNPEQGIDMIYGSNDYYLKKGK